MEEILGKLSPMMQHYLSIKEAHKDCIIFYRLGDFYEMFFDDAVEISRELELTLTGKECGLEERAPMCGIPHHAVDGYLTRLVQKGYKVAIVEQLEDPKATKGLVKRDVVRIVTPGTITSEQALEESKNNYLMCIVYLEKVFGVATADISTGEFFVTEVSELKNLNDEISRFMPSEIICNEATCMSGLDFNDLKDRLGIVVSSLANQYFDDVKAKETLQEHFKEETDLRNDSEMIAAGAILQYLYQTQMDSVGQLTTVQSYRSEKYMILDTSTRRNLELTQTLREKNKKGSLLGVLDHTQTAMGARMLRQWIEQPLLDKQEILDRQDAISELIERMIDREELREYLNPIYDLERLVSRIANHTATPRDLIAFKNSLKMLEPISSLIGTFESNLMRSLYTQLDPLEDIYNLIESAIVEEPPITMKEAGIIKDGYNEQADSYRKAKTEGKSWLAKVESDEREKTGIKNLKVKFNKVFGYYLEVTNSYKDLVPDYFIRKQTLVNAERYITEDLKKLEDVILGAEEKLCDLEYNLFCDVREKIAAQILRIQTSAKAVATLDVLSSLADVAVKNDYTKPKINTKGVINIKDGRHPVVEKLRKDEMFVANDTYLDNSSKRVAVITGPNMAGKSTYMRQSALIVLMAQIGSFVPAKSANISICDRIFTRVGASDDLASGQSTFMVEMTEVANILKNATRNSLLVLDEIGRGTSTYDGMSIAWAVIEYVSNARMLGAKTLFATHYHELTELEGVLPGVHNYCIAVKEKGDDIVFLRKIVKGGADKSYGIQVAKLAGVPDVVLNRAKQLVSELSDADITIRTRKIARGSQAAVSRVKKPDEVDLQQLTMFDTVKEESIIQEISDMNLTQMTPIDALNTLYRIQSKLKNRV